MKVTRKILPLFLFILYAVPAGMNAQEVPGPDENIPFLITFGKEGGVTSWGDDDFSQTFFFALPKDYKDPFYIRVYDPDTGGKTDELNNFWNTRMMYSIYGGKGCYTHEEANGISPTGNYRAGRFLQRVPSGWTTSLMNAGIPLARSIPLTVSITPSS